MDRPNGSGVISVIPATARSRTSRSRIFIAVLAAAMLAVAALPISVVGQEGPRDDTATIAEWDAYVRSVEEALEAGRFDRLHRDVVIDAVGTDPQAIADWVTTETRWVPYAGALRGGAGVLLDRTGNSLDRSLLLSGLLEETGLSVRLARAGLPEEVAADLLAAASTRPPLPAVEVPIFIDEDIHAGARERISAHADALSAMLDLNAVADQDAAALAAMTDHWWVQAQIDGEWVDLDPALSDATLRPAPEETYAPADIPDSVRNSVAIRLIIERWAEDGVSEAVAIEHTELLGLGEPLRALELTFDAEASGGTISPDADPSEVARAATHWRPVLETPDERIYGEWFAVTGDMEQPGSAGTEILSKGTDALGGLGTTDADEMESALSGAWVEYEINQPGSLARIERRELVDVLGGARRVEAASTVPVVTEDEIAERGLALLGSTSIVVEDAAAHPVYFERETLRDLVENRNTYIASALLAEGSDDERISDALGQADWRPLELIAALALRRSWALDPDTTFVGTAGVWTAHNFFDEGDAGLGFGQAIDVVVNDIDVFPYDQRDVARVRLEQGLLDTMTEAVALRSVALPNAWGRFDARDEQGSTWEALLTEEDLAASPVAAGLPPDTQARMAEALRQGYAIVASSEASSLLGEPYADWWRIDPVDGSALGIGYRGWGSDTTETIVIRQPGQSMIYRMCSQAEIRRQWFANVASVVYNVSATAAGRPQATPIPPGSPGWTPPCFPG